MNQDPEQQDHADNPVSPFPTKRFLRGRMFMVFCLLLLVAAALFNLTQYRDVRLIISKQTTLLTEPLDSSGNLDYQQAFEQINFSEKVTSPENGFRMIVEKINLFENTHPSHYGNVCNKLGLDPLKVESSLTYVDPHRHAIDYFHSKVFDESLVQKVELFLGDSVRQRAKGEKFKDWDMSEILVTRTIGPWTGKELPMMEKWVKENSPALDLYAKAVRQPIFEIPFSREDDSKSMYESLGYHMQVLRSAARGYLSRANYFLGRGEIRKAMEDVISCKRLGRHVCNRGTFLDRLLGIAIEGIADSIGVIDVTNDLATIEDLKYFISELNSVPKRLDFDRVIYHDKLAHLDWLQRGALRENDRWLEQSTNAKLFRRLGLDWNIVLTDFGKLYDHAWEVGLPTKRTDIEVTFWDYVSRASRSRKFVQWYWNINGGLAFVDADQRSTCADRMRQITLAMLCYEKEQGKLPPAYTTDKEGKPLHSWRVLLLPYLGQKKLYDELNLNEPWDSPHNSRFKLERPEVYACPGCSECKKGETSYSVVTGRDLPFDSNIGKKLDRFGPDCNDMILVVERTTPVDWMDPNQEIKQSDAEMGMNGDDEKDGTLPIGSQHTNGALFGFRNGAIMFQNKYAELGFFRDQIRGTNKRFVPY